MSNYFRYRRRRRLLLLPPPEPRDEELLQDRQQQQPLDDIRADDFRPPGRMKRCRRVALPAAHPCTAKEKEVVLVQSSKREGRSDVAWDDDFPGPGCCRSLPHRCPLGRR